MEEALAALTQLEARLEFELDAGQKRQAEGALEDLSDDARYYGSSEWRTPESTPRPVVNLILKAAVRFMMNPEGYIASRAGDEAVQWGDLRDPEAGGASFTPKEQKQLQGYAGRDSAGIYSVGIYAHQRRPKPTDGYVPAANGSPIPYFADGQGRV